ncbi:hypothetical protein M9458_053744 [Cirrhinus mrigala]|uniref:Uncharacterized protein n=1 Tax=Cirrhinus mrigala TaxID=683832 RepID=A0ABD0MQC8_CIRMR
MDTLKPPENLKLTGNVDSNWRSFKQQFELYMAAIGMDTKPEARKVALLLTIAGPQAIEVYNTFVFNENEDRNKLDDVLAKFTAHCSPIKNETYERYVFRSRVQQPQETFDNFLTDLRLKAKTCNFDQLSDSMIRDQIVFGIGDAKLRQRLLRETELTLQEAIKICQASELAQLHVKTFGEIMPKSMSSNTDAAIGAVSFKEKRRTFRAAKQKDGVYSCKRCGTDHHPKQCPAFGKQCAKCNETDLSDTFFVGMITYENLQESENNGCGQLSVNAQSQEDAVKNDKWVAPLQINGALVTLKLDTGAKANLISMSDIKNMTEKPKIKKKPILLKNYNGKSIDSLGICRLKVTVKEKVHHLLFSVVAEELESLLGDKACENLYLVKRVYHINHDNSAVTTSNSVDDIVQSFVDVFKGFGVLPYVYKIQLKENAQPVVHPARRVPAPLKGRLKKELDRMTTLGVIKRIQEPTDWVNSMVCVKKKNGDLRVCMDPKDLNDNIKPPTQNSESTTEEDIEIHVNLVRSPLECGMAPAEILMNRKLRTTLPSCAKRQGNVKMKQKLKQLKERQKFYYDRTTKHLQPLVRNDVVRIKDDENWSKKATVMQEVAPRSYTVKTNDGQIFRRNRRDLLRTEKEREELNQCNARSESTALSTTNDCNTDSNTETQIPDNQTFTLRRSTRHIKKPDRLNL